MQDKLVWLALAGGISSALAHAPSVQVAAGTIQGTTCKSSGANLFEGIPYAQPPTGKLRFMAPQKLNGTFDGGALKADTPPAPCIQMSGEFAWRTPTPSEDCLYLNVYTPKNVTKTSKLPVKVWAYGGGDIGGAVTYPLYDPCNLATDAIAVSFNYRLGPLGFLALSDAGIEGNMAIKDTVAALEWVNHNIEAFGGDKEKVVLFGQSSGADNTFVVSTLPQAKSLIKGAIIESGGGQDLPSYDLSQLVGASYAQTLNCSKTDLECLQSRSVVEIVNAFETDPVLQQGVGYDAAGLQVTSANTTTLSQSSIDGKFIASQPLKVGPQVPTIWGSNSNEGSLFTFPALFLSGGPIVEQNYTDFTSQFGNASEEIRQAYPLSLFNTTGLTNLTVVAAITHLVTTSSYTCLAYRGLRSSYNAGMPAYSYRFNHTPSCPWLWVDGAQFPGASLSQFVGPAHTAELPYVFGNVEQMPWGNGTCNSTASEVRLSRTLRSAWTAMADRADPSVKDLSWPRWDPCESRGEFIQDQPATQRLDFSECAFWDKVYAQLGGVAFEPVSNASCVAAQNSTSCR